MDKIRIFYADFLDSLTDGERATLRAFFTDFDQYFDTSSSERRRFREDFEMAIIALHSRGVPVEEITERLALSNLGGYYARPSVLWFPLDNSAKIYPISMDHGTQNLFRISVYFKEDILPEVMQIALTFTVKRFPAFATSLKKGVFWHYLDSVKCRFSLTEEHDVPCQPIKVSISGSSSFRLLYYKNRVSAEFFHVLTDGTGGTVFIKALAAEYLRLMGVKVSSTEGHDLWNINDTPTRDEFENAFERIERTKGSSGFIDRPATQMNGKLSVRRPCRILHLKMPTDALLSAARSYGATVTVYLLTLMFLAASAATDELSGELSIQVPVNMRKFYETRTVRNFAMYCGIRMAISDIGDKEDMVRAITSQLEQKASKESMQEMISASVKLVSALRCIPLVIKQPVARRVCGFLGEKIFSTTLSNLGVVTLPEELSEHIESMDFCLGAPEHNRLACAAISFGGVTTFSITKNTPDPTFEEKMLSLLSEDGIETRVEGSEFYER